MQTLRRPSYRANESKRTLSRVLGTSTVRFRVDGKVLTMSNRLQPPTVAVQMGHTGLQRPYASTTNEARIQPEGDKTCRRSRTNHCAACEAFVHYSTAMPRTIKPLRAKDNKHVHVLRAHFICTNPIPEW